jgi:heat shock protein HslJ
MPFRHSSVAAAFRIHSVSSRCRAALLLPAALSLGLAACGGAADPSSTDTGNPPVIVGQSLRVTSTATGVRVSGAPGTAPRGARVEVINLSTGESATTTAGSDGSFEVELAGTVADEYRVSSDLDGQTSSTHLTSAGASGAQVGLEGLVFLLQSAEGFTPVEGTSVRLSFEATTLGISGGCNSQFGSYSMCDGRLCVSELSRTEIGCEPGLDEQDTWLSDFFLGSPLVTQTGARLTLESPDATLSFLDREVADPDRPLVGPTWQVDTIIRGNGASAAGSTVSSSPTIEFRTDGEYNVFTGCNSGGGTYTAGNGSVSLSGATYTERGCGLSLATVEEHIVQVLAAGTVVYEIEARRLTLTREDVGLSATAD